MSVLSVGIDLGTSNSCVYYSNYDNKPAHVPFSQATNLVPSVVNFRGNTVLVGSVAVTRLRQFNNVPTVQQTLEPKLFVTNSKRILGVEFNEAQRMDPHICFADMRKAEDGLVEFIDDTQSLIKNPKEVASEILKYMIYEAERIGGKFVDSLVVTVPARFSDLQRKLTEDAARAVIRDSTRLTIISEPVAAAIANGVLNQQDNRIFVVYDLGGGTFDVTVLEIRNGLFKVLAVDGDSNIGGVSFDQKLVEFVINTSEKSGYPVKQDNFSKLDERKLRKKLSDRCKELKENLSSMECDTIDLSDMVPEYNLDIYRTDFEGLIRNDIDQTITIMDRAINAAGLTKDDIDYVIPIGGSTRIHFVERKIKAYFKNREGIILGIADYSEAVAQGACILARYIAKSHYSNVIRINDFDLYLNDGELFILKGYGDQVIDRVAVSSSEVSRYYKSPGEYFATHIYHSNDKYVGGFRVKKEKNDVFEVIFQKPTVSELHVVINRYETSEKVEEHTFKLT